MNDEVISLVGKWRKLATGLRIPLTLVALIFSNPSNDSEQCLLELLGEWLKQSYDVKRYGHPSWRALVRAVASSPGGGNPALAGSIADKHPGRIIVRKARLLLSQWKLSIHTYIYMYIYIYILVVRMCVLVPGAPLNVQAQTSGRPPKDQRSLKLPRK